MNASMILRRASWTASGLALAVASLAVSVTPAAAATTLIKCAPADCGQWQVQDGKAAPQGALCAYEKVSRDLDFITVRPPKMWDGPGTIRVQWRFHVRRSLDGGAYSTIHTSQYQTAPVGSGEVAYYGHGFTSMKWIAPEDPRGKYLIWIDMRWTLFGFAGPPDARAEVDWYKVNWNGTTPVRQNNCVWRV